ncbi:unnamed protein product, partial [Candidula unifasciata]
MYISVGEGSMLAKELTWLFSEKLSLFVNKIDVTKDINFTRQSYQDQFCALLQSHDVVAHEVYSEETGHHASPSTTHPSSIPAHSYVNGSMSGEGRGNGEVEGGGHRSDGGEGTLRVRLVQFQKNTDEPM